MRKLFSKVPPVLVAFWFAVVAPVVGYVAYTANQLHQEVSKVSHVKVVLVYPTATPSATPSATPTVVFKPVTTHTQVISPVTTKAVK